MRIYHSSAVHMTTFVTPAAGMSEAPSDWKDERGAPKSFQVQFVHGVAEVPGNLGEWMIKNDLANRTHLKRVRNAIQRAFA